MYGLPQSTEVNKQLPKKAIYAKFDLKPSQREHFDEDVSKLMIVNVISPLTITALRKGDIVDCIYVIEVQMKRKEYDSKNILLLCKLIPQKMLFILRYGELAQEVVSHTKLINSQWINANELSISLIGLTLDSIWQNLIIDIGQIIIKDGNTLEEQLVLNEEQNKLITRMMLLESKVKTEKQTKKKLKYFEEIQKIKGQIWKN